MAERNDLILLAAYETWGPYGRRHDAYGNWNEYDDGYLGIKFSSGAGTYYGWVRMNNDIGLVIEKEMAFQHFE